MTELHEMGVAKGDVIPLLLDQTLDFVSVALRLHGDQFTESGAIPLWPVLSKCQNEHRTSNGLVVSWSRPPTTDN